MRMRRHRHHLRPWIRSASVRLSSVSACVWCVKRYSAISWRDMRSRARRPGRTTRGRCRRRAASRSRVTPSSFSDASSASRIGFSAGPAAAAEARAPCRCRCRGPGTPRSCGISSLCCCDVRLRAVQPLLLAGEQDEADRPLAACVPQRGQDAGRLQHDAAAGAVVGRALAEVPRVEVGADDDELVRLLAAADLADGVVDRDRAGDELVADLHLDRGAAPAPAGWPGGRASRSGRGRRTTVGQAVARRWAGRCPASRRS